MENSDRDDAVQLAEACARAAYRILLAQEFIPVLRDQMVADAVRDLWPAVSPGSDTTPGMPASQLHLAIELTDSARRVLRHMRAPFADEVVRQTRQNLVSMLNRGTTKDA